MLETTLSDDEEWQEFFVSYNFLHFLVELYFNPHAKKILTNSWKSK